VPSTNLKLLSLTFFPSGWAHWYTLGLPQPSDPCACVKIVSPTPTTKSPSPATTSAPTQSSSAALKYFLDRMTPNATSPGSISFSPGVTPYSPWSPPPLSLTGSLMDKLISQTKFRTVMMYFMDYNTLQLAKQRNLKILGIVDLTAGDNTAVNNNAVQMAKLFPDTIIALACGNELGANYGMNSNTIRVITECVNALRKGKVSQPVGVIDTYYTWCNHQEKPCNVPWSVVSNQLDWLGLNAYPFWDNVYSGVFPCTTVSQAAAATLERHTYVMNNYKGKPVGK
jgi:hypothetical protein